MQPVATGFTRSMVCVSVCLCVGHKMAELIKIPFGGLTYVALSNHYLDGVRGKGHLRI